MTFDEFQFYFAQHYCKSDLGTSYPSYHISEAGIAGGRAAGTLELALQCVWKGMIYS